MSGVVYFRPPEVSRNVQKDICLVEGYEMTRRSVTRGVMNEHAMSSSRIFSLLFLLCHLTREHPRVRILLKLWAQEWIAWVQH